MSKYDFDPDPERAAAARELETKATRRDTYGFPMFLGAWIGGNAQWAAMQWPGHGGIAFLTAVVLICFFARSFNRRGGS